MNQKQLKRMKNDLGFIAALDQSGGSTPTALAHYGIKENSYHNEEEMFNLVHKMRTRMITSPSFNPQYILGAILFEGTMERKIEDQYTADYLWEQKQIVPFLKIDEGLDIEANDVQLMKPMAHLGALLDKANQYHIFGTKMRSLIKGANEVGIRSVVKQQFEVAKTILAHGLMPIIEPEVDIHIPDKKEAEAILKTQILHFLETLDHPIMLKLTLPTVDNFYLDLVNHPMVLRVVALSGGYSQVEANEILARNHDIIASFSRALSENLNVDQTDEDFNNQLSSSIKAIYQASIR